MTAARISQEVVEALYNTDPAARISQEVVEVLAQYSPPLRVSQFVVEVLVLMPNTQSTGYFIAGDLGLSGDVAFEHKFNNRPHMFVIT